MKPAKSPLPLADIPVVELGFRVPELGEALFFRQDVAEFNARTQANYEKQGLGDREPLTIVVGDFTGRTTLKTYLQGLTEKKYVVPKKTWDFSGNPDADDHDALLHFSRINELHPDMVDAVATYAAHGLELLAKDREKAVQCGNKLDIFLSILGRGINDSGLEIAIIHFQRKLGVDYETAQTLAKELLERQKEAEPQADNDVSSAITSAIMSLYVRKVPISDAKDSGEYSKTLKAPMSFYTESNDYQSPDWQKLSKRRSLNMLDRSSYTINNFS